MAPVTRVLQIGAAIVAHEVIGRHEYLRVDSGRTVDDGEFIKSERTFLLRLVDVRPRQRGCFLNQLELKSLQRIVCPVRHDLHLPELVADLAREIVFLRKPIDEWPEADALHVSR